jgi:hypothetical protein
MTTSSNDSRERDIMSLVNMGVNRIEVHEAGEDHAYWQLTFVGQAAGGGFGDYSYLWDWDDVTSNFTYNVGAKWLFNLSPGEKIRIVMFGQEVDNVGPNDSLPGVAVLVDPATAGQDYRVSGSDGEFSYTASFSFTVT